MGKVKKERMAMPSLLAKPAQAIDLTEEFTLAVDHLR
jgi:hypothetical protein